MRALRPILAALVVSHFMGEMIRLFKRNRIAFHDLTINVSSKQIRGKIISLLFFGKYEKEEIALIGKHMKSDLPIIDLGSSIGAVAVYAALRSRRNITCIEANPLLKNIISANLCENGIHPSRFSVHTLAICDKNDTDKHLYFSSGGSNELGRICDKEAPNSTLIDTISLSQIVKNELHQDYILISDIEGAEVAFLFSDVESLFHCKQLFIELHSIKWKGREYSVSNLIDRIKSIGYEMIEQRNNNFYFEQNEQR